MSIRNLKNYMNHEVIPLIERAVFASAQHMLSAFCSGRALQATHKADASVLTILDVESQEIIRQILGGVVPVVAEEDSLTHSFENLSEFILIDPLDGTSACKRFPGVVGGQVGYGPLVGYCRGGKLEAACYVNIPTRILYTAVKGRGAYEVALEAWSDAPHFEDRHRLLLTEFPNLMNSAIVFYTGLCGEIPSLEKLRKTHGFETAYRFGGFANDCTRLAHGYEQVGLQFSLKAWDVPAALIPMEAGLDVYVDPFGNPRPLGDCKIEPTCALVTSIPNLTELVINTIRDA
jgi:fructose-1,6-bisphosphatase/inositol monophosphatase family enzyme